MLLATLWIGASAAQALPQIESLHKEAMTALAKGDLPLAEKLEQQAIQHNPKDAIAHQGLAVIYARQGKTVEAIIQAKQAVEISPEKFSNQFNLAELLKAADNPEEALNYYNNALKISPSSVVAVIGKSRCLTELGNPLLALDLLEKTNRTNPDDLLQLQLAKTYFALGDFDKASDLLQKQLRQDSYEAKLLMSQIEFQKRNLPAAIILADQLIKKDPSQSGAYLLLSQCFVITRSGLLNAVNLVQSAKQSASNKAFVFSQLAQDFERCAASITKADLDFDDKRYAWRALAEECWRQAVKDKPSNADFRYRYAANLKKNRKFVEAYYQVSKCLELSPRNREALLLKEKLKQAKFDFLGWLKFYTEGRQL